MTYAYSASLPDWLPVACVGCVAILFVMMLAAITVAARFGDLVEAVSSIAHDQKAVRNKYAPDEPCEHCGK